MARKNVKVAELELLRGNDDTVDVTESLAALEMADRLEQLLEAEALAAQRPETADERFVRRIKEAQAKLGGLKVRPTTLALLRDACDNVAKSTGIGIEDKDAQRLVQDRAALFSACSCDLDAVVEVMSASIGVMELPGQLYSTCFAVQKAANFVANMKYRKALATDEDRRAELVEAGLAVGQSWDTAHREAPCGLEPGGEEPLNFDGVREHVDEQELPHHDVLRSLEELHVLLQLIPEAHGWDADAPMPFLYVQERDGKFTPIWGAEHALDIMEVRSKESRARRVKRQSAGLQAALAGARKALGQAVKAA